MGLGVSDDTDVFVIDGLTVLAKRLADGTYAAEVIDLPGCEARARTREQLAEATGKVIAAFLGR
jgi:predicted RNase H-like HicB family nuclease